MRLQSPSLADRAFRAIEVPLNLRWTLTQRAVELDPTANVLLFADPRGGSTWLAETLQSGLELELLWEPLQPRLVPRFGDLGFGWRQYIPAQAKWPAARRAFQDLLRGKLLNRHVCRYTRASRLAASERVLIKFCRGNALLPWFVRQFELAHEPVLLLRHPFAVAASQMGHGHWNEASYSFDASAPFSEREGAHASYLASLRTRPELLVATWCLANTAALEQPPADRPWITVYYEQLLAEPAEQLGRIFERWSLDLPKRVLEQVGKPSSMTKDASALHDSTKQIAKWRQVFSPADIERMLAVLDHFGVTVYSDQLMPAAEGSG